MKRIFFLLGGGLCLLLGLIGLALPVIPQVPFLVLGVLLLARGSDRLRKKVRSLPLYEEKIRPFIRSNPVLSKLLEDAEADGGIDHPEKEDSDLPA